MTERFIILLEKYFDNSLTTEEKSEFDSLIQNKNYKEEFEEQKRMKEVLSKMRLKNPSTEVWDNYWLGIYNRLERGLAWILVSIGAIILSAFAIYEIVSKMLEDTLTPGYIKIGISCLLLGGLILLFSVVREKIYTSIRDKYKEIQR